MRRSGGLQINLTTWGFLTFKHKGNFQLWSTQYSTDCGDCIGTGTVVAVINRATGRPLNNLSLLRLPTRGTLWKKIAKKTSFHLVFAILVCRLPFPLLKSVITTVGTFLEEQSLHRTAHQNFRIFNCLHSPWHTSYIPEWLMVSQCDCGNDGVKLTTEVHHPIP